MLLYYITDRSQFPGFPAEQRRCLLHKVSEAAQAGIDYVQLREKHLHARDLELLAKDAVEIIRQARSKTRLLINSRVDIAIAAHADGVHLRSKDISLDDVRTVWRNADARSAPIIAVSCHRDGEIIAAENMHADFVVFGPIFGKAGAAQTPVREPPAGVDRLRAASRHRIPVLALGGITLENARQCVDAGAAGIAGIRLFQENDLPAVVAALTRGSE